MPRTRKPKTPPWLQELTAFEDLAKAPAVLVAQMFCVLLGLALVAFSLAGMWGAWKQTAVTTTVPVTNSPMQTMTAVTTWSDARVATLLGTGLVLVLAGVFFNRITAITLPGGGGLTLGASNALTADVITAIVKKALADERYRKRSNIGAIVGTINDQFVDAAVYHPPVLGSTTPPDTYRRMNMAYQQSETGKRSDTPDTLGEILVDNAVDDLKLDA